MRKSLSLVMIAGLLLAISGFAAPSAMAAGPKPLVVLSLSSHSDVVGQIEALNEVAEAPEMPAWLSSTLKLFAGGRDLRGLDKSRPWGAVIQLDDKLSAYAFVPVADLEELSWELDAYIQSTTDLGGGMYEVVGTEGNKKLYTKQSGGWLFVSDDADTLDTVSENPCKLLGGLDKQYDVAVRFELGNVPAEHGKKILAKLDEKVGPTLRRMASQRTVGILGDAAFALQHVTLGWWQH